MQLKNIDRRQALKNIPLLGSTLLVPFDLFSKVPHQPITILLVSGWQYHNIGDIAHTPGLLNLLNIYLPGTRIILWPNHKVRAIDDMLLKKFPDLDIIDGEFDAENKGNAELQTATEKADFLLHGSGPSIVGRKKLTWWKDHVKKPYGIYGVTTQELSQPDRTIINGASFIFTRETHSLEILNRAGLNCKVMGFGPDATFAMNLLDENRGVAFLNKNDLVHKKYICVVPRLRKTPYYRIYPERNYTALQIAEIDALNKQHMESDFSKMREAMTSWVRQTGLPILVCPEMTYELDIMDALIDPLPSDVRSQVLKRDSYWLCDEAATVYANAFAVLSFECHSPIIAAYNGTPAFYLRQPEDTIKGQMWYDIGLDDWVFEIEKTSGNDISNRLIGIYNDYPQALRYLEKAMDYVREMQFKSMSQVRDAIQ